MPDVKEGASETELRRLAGALRANIPDFVRPRFIGRQQPGLFGWVVEQVSKHSRMPLEPGSGLAIAVAQCFQREVIEALATYKHPLLAEGGSQPPLIVIDSGLPQPDAGVAHAAISLAAGGWPVQDVGITINKAFEAWRDYSKGRSRKPQLVQEWDLAVRRFVAMFGDIDMGQVRPQMVRDFREKLLELPGRTKKSIKALALDEQAAIAAKEGLATLAPATVNKALSALRSITEHVIDKMSKVPLELNAARQAKFVEVEDSEDKRLPFDEEEMEAIFRDVVITDTTGISEETLFWRNCQEFCARGHIDG